jgi:uncharacterized membrane protein YfcA
MLAPSILAALSAIVLLAFVAEAAIGFGATVITVTLAVLLVPLKTILPAFVPINMLLSASILLRNRSHVRLDVLVREVAPLVVLGLGVGLWLFRSPHLTALQLSFSLFVVALSVIELSRTRSEVVSPLGGTVKQVLLALGGLVHGLFGTGGPMIVYVLQRRGLDKAELRATLALVWLCLNTALLANEWQLGLLGAPSLRLSMLLAVPLLPAMALGELLHRRLSPRRFTLGIFSLLLIAGLALGVRTALELVHR